MPTTKTTRKPTAARKRATSTIRKSTKRVQEQTVPSQPRRLRLPAPKLFRFKRVKYPDRLPSSWRLAGRTIALLWRKKWLFLAIAVVSAVLNIVLVQGFSAGADVDSLKQQLSLGLGGSLGQLVTGISVFSALLASAGNGSSPTAGSYQFVVGLIISLAVIWAVRQVTAGQKVRIRDAFYKGMYPLVPFVLVLLVVIIQTLPALFGGTVFSILIGNGIIISTEEFIPALLVFLILLLISLYMLCSSLFALYIVTLPDMTPIKALRSARLLVRYRRSQVLRKIIFLPIALLVIATAIMLPLIIVVPPVATWVFFALSTLGLIVIHAYMYMIYKALLA